MIGKIGKSLAEIENFIKEKYIQEMVLLGLEELEKLHSCKMCVRLFSRSQWS